MKKMIVTGSEGRFASVLKKTFKGKHIHYMNKNSFNILIDQIPKVCYYSNVKSKEGMVGPGQNYYAKV